MSLFLFNESKKYTDQKLGQIKRIEVLEEDPTNPQEGVLYFVAKGGGIPVKDYFFRFDAHSLDLADNDKVSSWEDLSEHGNHLRQSNETFQPTYLAAGLNGKPTVQFSETWLYREPFVLDNASAGTAFIVSQVDDGSSSSVVFTIAEREVTSHAFCIRISGSAGQIGLIVNAWSGGQYMASTSISSDATVLTGVYDGEDLSLYNNGVFADEKASATGGDLVTHDALRLGRSARNAGPEYFHGRISELIYFSRVLTTQEIADMNNYLMEKWGI